MPLSDIIQALIFIIMTASVIVLIIQTMLQNRLLKAQLLKDRFEMYWKTYEPVSDGHVKDFMLYTGDYMNPQRFEKTYKNKPEAMRKYIYMSMMYEYFAFTYKMQQLKIPDPLDKEWVRIWVTELCGVQEFRDVHEEYRGYYPDFEKFIDNVMLKTK